MTPPPKKKTPKPKPRSRATSTAANPRSQKAAASGKGDAIRRPSSTNSGKKFVKSSTTDAHAMMRILCDLYPNAECELNFASIFQLLVAVILSAQTTDTGVNKVTPVLFKRFPTAKALAEASLDEIKEIIRPTGYYNAKANNIQKCAQALVERFGGEVPSTLEELTTLPGVGRKTANVVLGVAYGEPAWTVDTHVQRLAGRFGFTPETDPLKIEFALQKLFPNEDWSRYSITLIWHGRRICFARNPNCSGCPINHLCPSSQV